MVGRDVKHQELAESGDLQGTGGSYDELESS